MRRRLGSGSRLQRVSVTAGARSGSAHCLFGRKRGHGPLSLDRPEREHKLEAHLVAHGRPRVGTERVLEGIQRRAWHRWGRADHPLRVGVRKERDAEPVWWAIRESTRIAPKV